MELPAPCYQAFPRPCSVPTPPWRGGPVTPTPSHHAGLVRALRWQQGPGAHLSPCFEANPLRIVLDGTLPGLPEKRRCTDSKPGACSIHRPIFGCCMLFRAGDEWVYLQEAKICPWEEGHNGHFILSAKNLPISFWVSFAKYPLKRTMEGFIAGQNWILSFWRAHTHNTSYICHFPADSGQHLPQVRSGDADVYSTLHRHSNWHHLHFPFKNINHTHI